MMTDWTKWGLFPTTLIGWFIWTNSRGLPVKEAKHNEVQYLSSENHHRWEENWHMREYSR